MLDFRYHALSLVAVFLALAIGIVLGVTVGGSLVSDAERSLRGNLRADVENALAALGTVRGFETGLIDIPFAASRQCKGAVMVARDNEGAVRYLDPGGVPVPQSVLKYHRARLDEREAARKRPIDYNAIVDDIFSISRGYLVAH